MVSRDALTMFLAVLIIVAFAVGYLIAKLSTTETKTSYIPYTITETTTTYKVYTITETRTITNTVTVARQPKEAVWEVRWYAITGESKWGGVVGSSTFPAVFDYDFGSGYVYDGYSDYIGFKAEMKIYVRRYGPVSFKVGADDGFRLYIYRPDTGDRLILSKDSGSYSEYSKVVYLDPGEYTLTLEYWEYRGNARVSFSTDSDVITYP
jgi:hypothetical protein